MEQLIYIGVDLPSSIRVIAIVKDPMGRDDAYTIEFECMADKSEDLMTELTKTPLGQRAIELINQARFMPENEPETQESLRAKAEQEAKEMAEHEEKIKEEAAKSAVSSRDYHWKRFIREKFGDEKMEEVKAEIDKVDEESKSAKEAKKELANVSDSSG